MKYFFLTEGWTLGRVWGSDGLWNEAAWRRQPEIQRINICLVEQSEKFWLHQVEDAVLTVEVKPLAIANSNGKAIKQVVLKRLISAEQVLERLSAAQAMCYLTSIQAVVQ